MPYIEKVTRAGRTVLYERSYSSHIHPPGATRSEKMKDTKESQKKINLRKAITELTILMNANFVPGDYHITLTYERDKRAETVEEAKRDRKIFLDRLRRRMIHSGNGSWSSWCTASSYGDESGAGRVDSASVETWTY